MQRLREPFYEEKEGKIMRKSDPIASKAQKVFWVLVSEDLNLGSLGWEAAKSCGRYL